MNRLSYELAKELKDAGFPQIPKEKPDDWFAYKEETDETVILPTLDELIDWCGDRFVAVNRLYDDHHRTVGWEAVGFGGQYPQIMTDFIKETSKIRKEAVARLGIALKKKLKL